MANGYILSFEDVTADIRIIAIQISKEKNYIFHAGQYAEIEVEGCEPRYFSIANAPRSDNIIDIHVRNIGGDVSHALCRDIKQGQGVTVSNAQGLLKFIENDNAKVFLAGGTGVTPFLAMIEGAKPQTQMSLYWGMETPRDFYVRPQQNGLSVIYCTDIYPVDAYIQNMIMGADVYLSGPPAMVNDSRSKLLAAGVEPSNILFDE
ncbi:MAG: hypothetical protein COB76_06940 [Alphaproteobacteria bacterium]|nr:MAG: hypothetical protein COB76_06940 [Alphaproteobacteria bacterium]